MTGAREEILDRIRLALGPERPETASGPDLPTSPWDAPTTVATFIENTADYRAVVERCSSAALPGRIAAALTQARARAVVRPSGLEEGWLADHAGDVVTDDGLTAYDLDEVDAVVTGAAVGIAATGTIVLDHALDQGRRAITLVPDVHVCVVHASQVVPDVPEAIGTLRPAVKKGHPLTWISGPSATSDIELDRVEGVHGPRTLHVIVVD